MPEGTTIELPMPPSVNRYWRTFRGRMILSEPGRRYRTDVQAAVLTQGARKVEGRLSVAIKLHAPDKRRRDLDNVCKGILDGLAHAGVYVDDSQIDDLRVERAANVPGGKVVVTVQPIAEAAQREALEVKAKKAKSA